LNETKDENMLDYVVKEGDLQESVDDSGSQETTTDTVEKEGQKNKTAKVVFGYIRVLRQIENHFYLAEPFLREKFQEGELKCIEEALGQIMHDESSTNDEDILNLRVKLADMHRPQNGDQQNIDHSQDTRAAEPSDSIVTNGDVGMAHG
jgi:hypothetical protein